MPLILLLHLLNLLLLLFAYDLFLLDLAAQSGNFLFPDSKFFGQRFEALSLLFCIGGSLDLDSLRLILLFQLFYFLFEFYLHLTLLTIASLPVNCWCSAFLGKFLHFCKFFVQVSYLIIVLLDFFLCVLDFFLSCHDQVLSQDLVVFFLNVILLMKSLPLDHFLNQVI